MKSIIKKKKKKKERGVVYTYIDTHHRSYSHSTVVELLTVIEMPIFS